MAQAECVCTRDAAGYRSILVCFLLLMSKRLELTEDFPVGLKQEFAALGAVSSAHRTSIQNQPKSQSPQQEGPSCRTVDHLGGGEGVDLLEPQAENAKIEE